MESDAEAVAILQLAHDYYMGQLAISKRARRQAKKMWRQLDPGDFDRSWWDIGPALTEMVTNAQVLAAAAGPGYVDAAVQAGGATSDWAGTINPKAFGGYTAEGRQLAEVLYQPIIGNKLRIRDGMSVRDAMAMGGRQLDKMVDTVIPDAGRGAVGASIVSNRTATGYVRVMTGKGCARCAVLAGKHFAFNAGFRRHPRCKCIHVPSTRNLRPSASSPKDYFESLDKVDQDRIFTKSGARAIRDGADISQVVNLGRDLKTGVESTRTGTMRNSVYRAVERRRQLEAGLIKPGSDHRMLRPAARLTPDAIYRIAGTRQNAISMLQRYGYITPVWSDVTRSLVYR